VGFGICKKREAFKGKNRRGEVLDSITGKTGTEQWVNKPGKGWNTGGPKTIPCCERFGTGGGKKKKRG